MQIINQFDEIGSLSCCISLYLSYTLLSLLYKVRYLTTLTFHFGETSLSCFFDLGRDAAGLVRFEAFKSGVEIVALVARQDFLPRIAYLTYFWYEYLILTLTSVIMNDFIIYFMATLSDLCNRSAVTMQETESVEGSCSL